MVNRTWFCLNIHCKSTFDMPDVDNPPCPRCGGKRTQWVPKPFAIKSAKTQNADQALKEVQAMYPDHQFNSPRRGEKTAASRVPVTVPGRTRRFNAPGQAGWGVDLPLDRNGQLYNSSLCAPTGVTAPIKAQVGQKSQINAWSKTSSGAVPNVQHQPYRPAGGIPR